MIIKTGNRRAEKTVNEETEIDSLYKSFPSFPFKEKRLYISILLEVLYLLFYLADGTSLRLTTCLSPQKSGRLQSENAGFDYFHQVILSGYGKIYLEKVKSRFHLRTLLDISVFKEIANKSLTARHPSVFFAWMPFVTSSSSRSLLFPVLRTRKGLECDWLNSSRARRFQQIFFIFFRHIWKYGHLSP